MKLSDIASVRTGLVTSRKAIKLPTGDEYEYKMINLRCITDSGAIYDDYIETYYSKEQLREDYFTRQNDILIRLSFPYTAVIISEAKNTGLLIPSHFAVIRVNQDMAAPEFIYWELSRIKTKQKIIQSCSGSTSFGTISSGFFSDLTIRSLDLKKQKAIGQLFILSERERQLLQELTEIKTVYNNLQIKKIYDNVKKGK